jgi:hypothetical protein
VFAELLVASGFESSVPVFSDNVGCSNFSVMKAAQTAALQWLAGTRKSARRGTKTLFHESSRLMFRA